MTQALRENIQHWESNPQSSNTFPPASFHLLPPASCRNQPHHFLACPFCIFLDTKEQVHANAPFLGTRLFCLCFTSFFFPVEIQLTYNIMLVSSVLHRGLTFAYLMK